VKLYDTNFYKGLQKDLSKVEGFIDFTKVLSADKTIMDEEAMVALVNAVQMLISNHNTIVERLNKIDFTAEADFTKNMGKYANYIRSALAYAYTAENIVKLIKQYTVNDKTLPSEVVLNDFTQIKVPAKYGGMTYVDLTEINKRLDTLVNSAGGMFRVVKAK